MVSDKFLGNVKSFGNGFGVVVDVEREEGGGKIGVVGEEGDVFVLEVGVVDVVD